MRLGRTVFAVVVLIALGVGPARAAVEFDSSIAGTVKDVTGAPVEGICVYADGGWWGSSDETGVDGTYLLADLEAGSYAVAFFDCRAEPSYVAQWYDHKSSYSEADAVEVGSGEAVTGVDADLVPGGFVTGTLTDEAGAPAQACVAAYADEWSEPLARGFSDENGAYRVGPVLGDVRLRFGDCGFYGPTPVPVASEGGTARSTVVIGPDGGDYVPEWYDDARRFADATPVPVASGIEIPGIDAVLAPGATLSGVVTNEAGAGLEHVCVDVSGADGGSFTTTGENGAWLVGQLAAGSYTVGFFDCDRGIYASEWWDDEPSPASADAIELAKGASVTHVDAALAKRPRPDYAVTKLGVRENPLRTDAVTLPGTGLSRTVEVEVANLGTARGLGGYLTVWVEMRSGGGRKTLGAEYVELDPSKVRRFSFEWNGTGSFGDATVHADVCAHDDGDPSNDHRIARSYVLAGGTGLGFSAGRGPLIYPGCREVVIQPTAVPAPAF